MYDSYDPSRSPTAKKIRSASIYLRNQWLQRCCQWSFHYLSWSAWSSCNGFCGPFFLLKNKNQPPGQVSSSSTMDRCCSDPSAPVSKMVSSTTYSHDSQDLCQYTGNLRGSNICQPAVVGEWNSYIPSRHGLWGKTADTDYFSQGLVAWNKKDPGKYRLGTHQEQVFFAGGAQLIMQNGTVVEIPEESGPSFVMSGIESDIPFTVRETLLMTCPEWKTFSFSTRVQLLWGQPKRRKVCCIHMRIESGRNQVARLRTRKELFSTQ